MIHYRIGDVIRDARLRHNLTQEELAFGICSVSNLSKIENGSRIPHHSTFEALMQRMGEPWNMYVFFAGDQELAKRKLLCEIERQFWLQNTGKLQELLEQYGHLIGETQRLEWQQKCLMDVVLMIFTRQPVSEIKQRLMEAMQMTRPDFAGTWEEGAMYTHNELLGLHAAAACYQILRQWNSAAAILQELPEYYQKHVFFKDTWAENMELFLYYQSAELYFQMKEYPRSVQFSQKGIQRGILMEKYYAIPRFLVQRSRMMAELGDMAESYQAEQNAVLLKDIVTNQMYLSRFL